MIAGGVGVSIIKGMVWGETKKIVFFPKDSELIPVATGCRLTASIIFKLFVE